MIYNLLRVQWHRAVAVVAAIAGVVLFVAGWIGVSGSSLTTEQIPYLASGAVGGLFALGVAATLWLSADLRDEFVKLDDIYRWMTGDQIDHQADHQSNGETLGPTEPDVEYASTAARRRPLRARPPMSSDR